MKYLGGSVFNNFVKFFNEVYIETPIAQGSDPDKFLCLSSHGKVTYRTGAQVLSDIGGMGSWEVQTDTGAGDLVTISSSSETLGIVGGEGINSTNSGNTVTIAAENASDTNKGVAKFHTDDFSVDAGAVTLAALGIDHFATNAIQLGSESFVDNDTSLMTSAAVQDKIEAYGYSTTTGDITGVTAGTNLSGGGTSGAVTINLADASTSAKGAGRFSSDNFAASSGTISIKNEGVDLTTEVTGVLPSVNSKHLAYYRFMGYSTGDGTNYEMGQQMTDGQAPFEHADTSSSDGLTIPAGTGSNVSDIFRMGGHVMNNAGTLKKWTGWVSYNDNGNDCYIALFKWSPVANNTTDISPSHGGLTLLDEATIAGKANDKVMPLVETTFTSASVAVGDIIFTQVKTSTNAKIVYFNTTLEVEF